MTARSLAVIVCALSAGCSLDSDGTGTFAAEPDAAPDTSLAVEGDTGSIFEPEDAVVPEAAQPDTAIVDSSVPDTAIVDSSVPDTAPPPETLTVTTVSLGVAARTVDLTAEGTRDWAHWGHTMTGSFNRKSDAVAIVNGGASGASTFESSVLRFTWTNGAPPNKSVTETPRGLTMSSGGEYVSFDVQGDPTRELALDVFVSGTSDATIAGTLTESIKSISAGLGAGVYIVTFRFRTNVMASKLHVEMKKGPTIGSFNLFAASLK